MFRSHETLLTKVGAKSKKNKKKNQANKQNAHSGKAAENETQNDAVVEEELKDEQEGEEVNILLMQY